MNWSLWIRQFHRWVSILFSAIVLAIFVTLGLGMFIGSWVSGRIVDAFALPGGGHAWERIWIMPAAMAGAVLLLFAAFFRAAGTAHAPAHSRAVTSTP